MLTQQFIAVDSQRDEYTSYRKYYKVNLGLTAIPTDIPADALEVYITSNDITKIEANVFSELSQCRRLYLRFNDIIDLEPAAFNGLTSLLVLDLWAIRSVN